MSIWRSTNSPQAKTAQALALISREVYLRRVLIGRPIRALRTTRESSVTSRQTLYKSVVVSLFSQNLPQRLRSTQQIGWCAWHVLFSDAYGDLRPKTESRQVNETASRRQIYKRGSKTLGVKAWEVKICLTCYPLHSEYYSYSPHQEQTRRPILKRRQTGLFISIFVCVVFSSFYVSSYSTHGKHKLALAPSRTVWLSYTSSEPIWSHSIDRSSYWFDIVGLLTENGQTLTRPHSSWRHNFDFGLGLCTEDNCTKAVVATKKNCIIKHYLRTYDDPSTQPLVSVSKGNSWTLWRIFSNGLAHTASNSRDSTRKA